MTEIKSTILYSRVPNNENTIPIKRQGDVLKKKDERRNEERRKGMQQEKKLHRHQQWPMPFSVTMDERSR
ncbi:hypothetical protein C7R88_03995 [Plesiomonas shigelloides]|nr:hypothetical protein C7R88_03995 [Plesiomonas shigelloides]